jgi:hypothetical protein
MMNMASRVIFSVLGAGAVAGAGYVLWRTWRSRIRPGNGAAKNPGAQSSAFSPAQNVAAPITAPSATVGAAPPAASSSARQAADDMPEPDAASTHSPPEPEQAIPLNTATPTRLVSPPVVPRVAVERRTRFEQPRAENIIENARRVFPELTLALIRATGRA